MIFYNLLNETRIAIKFTMEKEINNETSYLNLPVKKRNIDFKTTVFRKETFTDNYLNFGYIVAKSGKPTSSGFCVIVHI